MIQRILFALALAFRVIVSGLILHIAHDALEITTQLPFLIVALILGHFLGTGLAFTKVKFWLLPLFFSLAFIALNLSYWLIGSRLFGGSAALILYPYSVLLDLNLLIAVCGAVAITTYAYWRSSNYATFEALVVILILVQFLAPHREMQLANAPKLIQSLAWQLHTSSFFLIISSGAVITLLTAIYFALSNHAARPEAKLKNRPIIYAGQGRVLGSTLAVGALIAIIIFTSRQIYNHYLPLSISMGSNGVGFSEDSESIGKSPLGFHSALGSNNQPAAMVRLDGDYTENPFSPMLYLREGALSKFDGQEFVSAGKGYDDDVTHLSPNQQYLGEEKSELIDRVSVNQSIYLLSKHEVSFGIDYPTKVTPLENPAPDRFQGAFKSYSAAPTYKPDDLANVKAGKSDWTEEIKQHYLETHHDQRYKDLALKIVGDITNPAMKAKALTDYLSQKSIYTLTPNHELDTNGDPVAPYLFGDMRGYCVHFAHATAYMLRALGIPARIGTGYMTDLSQAKDGHILLRMSDRHAWAEAYFEGYGWVPFDTQPKQVESHADTEVDANLLEELMGLVGSENEILPPESSLDELAFEEELPLFNLPSIKTLWLILTGIMLLYLVIKSYLWYGFMFASSNKNFLIKSLTAIESRLIDHGKPREYGETSKQYLTRIKNDQGLSLHRVWSKFNENKYALTEHEITLIKEALSNDLKELKSIKLWKNILAFINPSSLLWRIK